MNYDERNEKSYVSSIRDLLSTAFRQKRKILVFFWAVTLTVAVTTFLSDRIYESQADLLMRAGREGVALDPSISSQNAGLIDINLESQLNSAISVIKSRELAETVVRVIGLERFLATPPKPEYGPGFNLRAMATDGRYAIKDYARKLVAYIFPPEPMNPDNPALKDTITRQVMKNLSAEPLQRSNVITLSYSASDPQLAQDVLAAFLQLYMEKHIRVNQSPGTGKFFDQQAEKLLVDMRQTETELRDYKIKTGIANVDEQRNILMHRFGSLQSQLEDNASSLAASLAKRKELKSRLDVLPESVVNSVTTGSAGTALAEMQRKLYELRLKEQELLSTYTEQNVAVKEIRRQIREAEEMLKKSDDVKQVTKGVNETHQKILYDYLNEEGVIVSRKSQGTVLEEQLDKTQEQIKKLNEHEFEIMRLQRRLELQEATYRKYVENLEQSRIDQALKIEKITNISVIQPATLPIRPAKPKTVINIVLGMLLGLIGGVGIAFVLEYFDQTFKNPDDLEHKIDLSVLACIPHSGSRTPQSILEGRQWPLALTEALSNNPDFSPRAMLEAGEGLKSLPGDTAPENEDGETTTAAPPRNPQGKIGRVVAVTSCYRGEGVSSVASNLALNLAQQTSSRVLLVDGNQEHPTVHKFFRFDQAPGLTELLAGNDTTLETVIHRVKEAPNLDILCAGSTDSNLLRYFNTSDFQNLLADLKRAYRVIIFDTPAVSETTRAIRIASLVDGVILVVEAEKVRSVVVDKVKRILQKSGAHLFGAILNKRRFHIPDWLYSRLL